MNVMQWIRNLARTTPEKPGRTGWYWPGTQSGEHVDEDVALRYSAVWGCVRIISETIATLPWCVFQRNAKGRKEDTKSAIYWILHNQPNPEMTAFLFKELMVRRALLAGNSYAEIERDKSGRPIWLWPIDPARVRVDRDDNGKIIYRVQDPSNQEVTLSAADVFHLRGPGGDGLTGYSMIRYAAESIGTGTAMDRFGASFFGNGAHVSVVLKHPKTLGADALKHLKESIAEKFSGKKALSPMVLEEGMTMERMGVPPEDAQFLESRKFQIGDIARWYRVPPHKLGLLDRATWSNIEQQAIEFVTDAIVPWCVRMEQEADLKLYGRNNQGVYYTKLNVAAIMRGDMKSRYDAYAVGRQWGWLSANDVLEFEDSNPIKNGDLYLVPSNMTTPELVKNPPKPQPALAAPKQDDAGTDANADEPAPIADKRKLNGTHKGRLNG